MTAAIPALAGERTTVPAAKIDAIFAQWDTTHSPGVVLAIIQDGAIVYQRGYGMANLEQDVPLSPDSVFYIASTSKQFTATSMALLARQGKVSLDDDVRKYITELPDYGATITIRHLIHHTSGLRDYLTLNSIGGRTTSGLTNDDAVRLIARQKELNARPGEEYSYSNSGYVLMSTIIKRASGKSLREFSDEFIFRPLGMTHSLFRDDRSMIIKRRVTGYAPAPGGFRTDDSDIETTGGGNVWTTVGDLLLWDRSFYDNRLGDGLTKQLLSPGKLADGRVLDYAYGLHVDKYKGFTRVEHGGAFAGFRSEMIRFPEQRLTVICLANLGSIEPEALSLQVADLYLADSIPAQPAVAADLSPVKLTADDLAAFAGSYRDPRDGSLWTFIVDDDVLQLERFGPFRIAMLPTGEAGFRDKDGRRNLVCTFIPPQDAKPGQVRVQIDGGTARTFEAVKLASPTPDELQAYAGSYFSPEAEATLTLIFDEGRLKLDAPARPREPLKAGASDEFLGSIGTLQFERNSSNQVTGFRYNLPRVRKLQFNRR
ncbi:MAG TPA: serine hydrolase domain-containing protein [Pirellulales bacterium]